MKILPEKINRILILQTAFIGDVVMSTPVPREVKKIFPRADVDILTIPAISPLFAHNPHIRERHTFFKKKFFRKWRDFFRLVRVLHREKYDVAISLQSSLTSAMLLLFAKIPLRIGFHRQPLMTHKVEPTPGIHRRIQYLELLSVLTDAKLKDDTELFFSDEDREMARSIINEHSGNNHRKIGIAPGSVWFTKTWRREHYIRLVNLLKDDSDKYLFFIGGKDERALCRRIIDESGNPDCVNLAGELSMLESAALISELDLMLCNDSAPLHIANAVNTPVFAFFGPTVREFGCFPYREKDRIFEIDLSCRPCAPHGGRKCPLKHHDCMRRIKPDMVYQAIRDFFSGK